MAGNADFDEILSTTLKNYVPKLEDNVFTARAMTAWLKRKDRVKMKSGGQKIVVPIMYEGNSTSASYARYDTILTTPQEGITAAEYSWKQFAASIAIDGLSEAQNAGEQEIIDLLEAKIMQAEESIAEDWDVMFFADGTGNSSKEFNGLGIIVEATGSLGGIDPSSNTWWKSYEENTSAVLTLGQMGTAYNTVSRGNDQPDFIMTTQTLFEKYESLLQPALRFQDSKTADGGFQNLLFKTAPVMFDTNCTSGVMFFLNSKYLYLVGHTGNWFRTTPFKQPTNQDARYAQIICYGELVTSHRARQGKLTAKTAV